jgi:hypothetical protein
VWSQRLGYLLDITHHRALADALAPHVRERAKAAAPLVRSGSRTGTTYEGRWMLRVNAVLEPDL